MRVESLSPVGLEIHKARAILCDGEDIMYLEYNGGTTSDQTMMFPGGKIDASDASARGAAVREIREECGLVIAPEQLEVLGDIALCGHDYQTRDGAIEPEHIVVTRFFTGSVTGVERVGASLSAREKAGRCTLRRAKLGDLLEMVEAYSTDNPRWPFFQEEMRLALGMYVKGGDDA